MNYFDEEAEAATEEFQNVCDAIIIAANSVKDAISKGSTVEFVQGALVLSSAVGFLSSAASMIMETSMNEVHEAIGKAGERMVDDVLKFLKEDEK